MNKIIKGCTDLNFGYLHLRDSGKRLAIVDRQFIKGGLLLYVYVYESANIKNIKVYIANQQKPMDFINIKYLFIDPELKISLKIPPCFF